MGCLLYTSHEMEVSIKAGGIVGLIYDAFLKQYRICYIVDADIKGFLY